MPIEIVPEDAGLVLADIYGEGLLREAPELRIATATRRAVLMGLAKAAVHHRHHRLSGLDLAAESR